MKLNLHAIDDGSGLCIPIGIVERDYRVETSTSCVKQSSTGGQGERKADGGV
jgi:hypothetical protein